MCGKVRLQNYNVLVLTSLFPRQPYAIAVCNFYTLHVLLGFHSFGFYSSHLDPRLYFSLLLFFLFPSPLFFPDPASICRILDLSHNEDSSRLKRNIIQ
ncbi:hypothetical protein GGR58DRAFT_456496 [Xylaria digitata]|nr:hypothetical protein GGR58DRAFT_456496 [Xylaria digitata]